MRGRGILFVIFFGSGAAALEYPIDRLTVCELNADVVQASRTHFSPYLYGLFEDPRAEVIAEDGRNFLAGTDRRFDVVVADIFLTYRAGVGSLYTLERFRSVRERRAPGGIFVQWLPAFEMSETEFGIVARTMLEVFPRVTLWRRSYSPRFPLLALVGTLDDSPLDLPSFERDVGAQRRGRASARRVDPTHPALRLRREPLRHPGRLRSIPREHRRPAAARIPGAGDRAPVQGSAHASRGGVASARRLFRETARGVPARDGSVSARHRRRAAE